MNPKSVFKNKIRSTRATVFGDNIILCVVLIGFKIVTILTFAHARTPIKNNPFIRTGDKMSRLYSH